MSGTRKVKTKPNNQHSKPPKTSPSGKPHASPEPAASSVEDSVKMDATNSGRRDMLNQDILEAIASLKTESLARHREVIDGIAHIRSDLDAMKTRMATAEQRIGDTEDVTTQLMATVSELEAKVKQLTEKNDDLENRSRRSNLRITGLEERAEGADAESFLENWLTEVLGSENFPHPLRIERAHRIANATPPVNTSGKQKQKPTTDRPRTLIAKVLNFKDKARVMNAAREKKTIMYNNRKVKFFSDFSAEVTRQRNAYYAVKQTLYSKGIEYGLQYPAKLRVTYEGKDIVFKTPGEVDAFLHSIDDESVSDSG